MLKPGPQGSSLEHIHLLNAIMDFECTLMGTNTSVVPCLDWYVVSPEVLASRPWQGLLHSKRAA